MSMSICENCGVEFEQHNKYRESKTCSKKCRYALSGKSNKQTQGPQYLDRECPQCGKSFNGKAFHCSRECANKSRSGDKHPAAQNAKESRDRPCKVCSSPTQNSQRDTCPLHRRGWQKREIPLCPCGLRAENIRSKYCGEEHRKKWGKKAPAQTVTKTCLGCGQEFTRPHFFPGKMKYCSNRCAHKEQKMTTEVGALLSNDRTIIFRSGWEIRFWALCLRFDIPIRSYDGPDIQTSVGIYRPDFIIETLVGERIVEVKGYLRSGNQEKVEEAGVWVIDQGILESLESGDLSALLDSPHPTMC